MVTKSNIVPKKSASAASRSELSRIEHLLSTTAVERVLIASLKANPRNAKRHPQQQIVLLAENIRKFGQTQPIVIDEDQMILAGHGRVEAATLLGMTETLAIRLRHLTPNEKRALAIADNKLPELGSWDNDVLRGELQILSDPTLDMGFDPAIMGFDTVEIDQILTADGPAEKRDPADELPEFSADDQPITEAGDMWVCGEHWVLCGDALEAENHQRLIRNEPANMVFTDPPYNVPNSGHVTRRKGVREFAMARGEMNFEEFVGFLRSFCGHIADHVVPGAVVFICIDWRHIDELSAATRRFFGKLKNMIVWVKTNAGMGSFYRSQHEHIGVYVAPGAPPINNFHLGERGRFRSNVWRYPGFNTFGRDRDTILALHPTVKPVAMVMDALRDCSRRGGIVLDPFAGSGTTMIAAQRTGRRARLMEIDPLYCDVIIKRWQTQFGLVARLAETDETFEQVSARRARNVTGGRDDR